MKIKLSKSQWEEMGKQAGWMKVAEKMIECSYCGKEFPEGELHELKKGKSWCCDKCLEKNPEKNG